MQTSMGQNAGNGKWQKDAADQNFDYMFKLLIIGNSSVGKTSFLFRYADDSFTSAFVSTVGIDFKVKTVYRNDKRVKLQIWVKRGAFIKINSTAIHGKVIKPIGLLTPLKTI
jgi:Ras family